MSPPGGRRTGASPTPRAVALLLAVAALLALTGALAPGVGAAGWVLALAAAALVALDLALAAAPARASFELEVPATARVGPPAAAGLRLAFLGARPPASADATFTADARLRLEPERLRLPLEAGAGASAFRLTGRTRGRARLHALALRWTGPLGLAHRRLEAPLERGVAVLPDIAAAQALAVRLSRAAPPGRRPDLRTGAEGEFQALGAFPPGGDRRTIDWKRSARHGALLAKEHRAERNSALVLALDCGRQMIEPAGDRSRLDHALSAALAAAYAGLAGGDRVKLFAFDGRPRVSGPFLSGVRAFSTLQSLGAEVEASTDETNHTLALLELTTTLDRRALVVVFTEFTDTVGAELMLEAAGRLARRHRVLFVVFRDAELEALARAAPEAPEDVSRAVIAADLLRERAVVLERLRRLGVRVVETGATRLAAATVDTYFDIKRRALL